jgi:ABC-type dipeptide/oligopeptide/nickel transport system ATPase component
LTGCPFHPRCDHKIAGVCDRIVPEPITLGPNHTARCLLYDETYQEATYERN